MRHRVRHRTARRLVRVVRLVRLVRLATLIPALLFAGAAIAPQAGTVLVVDKSDNTVSLVDPASGERRVAIPVGVGPHEVAVAPGGERALVTNYGRQGMPGSSVTLVDVRAGEPIRAIDLGEHTRPHGVAFLDSKRAVVTTEGSRHLVVVDIETGGVVQAIGTGQAVSHMVALAPDRRRAYVANIGSGSMTAIDLVKGAVIASVPTGAEAEGIAVTPDGREVWVSNRRAGTVSVVDAARLEVVAEIPSPGFPIRVAITPDGKRAFVSAAQAGEVAAIDVATRKEVARVKLAEAVDRAEAKTRLFSDFGDSPVPVGLLVSPDGGTLWVACTNADVVVALSASDLSVTGRLRAGRQPDGMAYSPIDAAPKRGGGK